MAESKEERFAGAQRFIGTSVRRSEDPRILTGSGRYVGDVRIPGMLQAAFARSPFAHARVLRVNLEAARALPGVVAVFDGAAMGRLARGTGVMAAAFGVPGEGEPSYSLLATTKVRLVGDPVALVVAEDRYVAEDACELIEVEYEVLPAVMTAEQAKDPASPPIFEDRAGNLWDGSKRETFGDLDAVFSRADRVVRANLRQHRHQNVPMEGRGIVAHFDTERGELVVHSATQGVHVVRKVMADQLGLDPDRVHVFAGDIGGSFGLKLGVSREEIACAAASLQLRRPVRWIEDRGENLTVSGQARDESFEVEAAVAADGEILGLKVEMEMDTGAYPGMGPFIVGTIRRMLPGPYRMSAISFHDTEVITNKASYVAYRGPWAAETWVRERMVDLIAAELGMEPLELRRRNVAVRGEPPLALVTGPSLAGVTASESLERMAALIDLGEFRARQAAAREEGRYLGIGFATYLEPAPGPRQPAEAGAEESETERVRIRLEADGSLSVFTSQMPHGQGHQTTLAQIAADQFGVDFEQVQVVVGDSARDPDGFGTGGSLSATMTGGATLHAARQLRAKVLEVAAQLVDASPVDLDIGRGVVKVRDAPDLAMPLVEVAAAAERRSLPAGVDTDLEVTVEYDGGSGGWSGGTHCAVVEVDVETGKVRIERYLVVEDCGQMINPAVVAGQVRGGIAQGIGSVLLERSVYDENGQYLSGSLVDYLLPTATDVPRIEVEHLQTVPLDPDVNFRGVGEGGMIVAPPTLCNAISDALAPFGVRITEQHLPPTRLLELIGTIEA